MARRASFEDDPEHLAVAWLEFPGPTIYRHHKDDGAARPAKVTSQPQPSSVLPFSVNRFSTTETARNSSAVPFAAARNQHLPRPDLSQDVIDVAKPPQQSRQNAGGVDRPSFGRKQGTEARYQVLGRDPVDRRLDRRGAYELPSEGTAGASQKLLRRRRTGRRTRRAQNPKSASEGRRRTAQSARQSLRSASGNFASSASSRMPARSVSSFQCLRL